jgi:two-component system chemotaxis sensor kinase CheA
LNNSKKDPMLEMFIFETNQLIDQLEEILLASEESKDLTGENINEIFRIMHTIKSSSAMMEFNNISKLSHKVEDLFYLIRENRPDNLDCSQICDLVLLAFDFIKGELSKIEEGKDSDGDESSIVKKISSYVEKLSENGEINKDNVDLNLKNPGPVNMQPEEQKAADPETAKQTGLSVFEAKVYFEEGCGMEDIRAFSIVNNLKDISTDIHYIPENLDSSASEYIIENGFFVGFKSESDISKIKKVFEDELFVKNYELNYVNKEKDEQEIKAADKQKSETSEKNNSLKNINEQLTKNIKQSLINVNVLKLDKLMDLVGEIVITESMVTGNPDLLGLQLDNFSKSARQLRKLTDELQDTVMSIRMVPIASTFQRMHRIVRDMGKKLNKEVEFVISGEDTEVDKSIIDHLSDPLMHLVRNAMDHGIECESERISKGKSTKGKVTLNAKNSGGEVIITLTDDGRGMDKKRIFEKAKEKGLTDKNENEITDNEIYSFIMLPGFSTNDKVDEYSGRGVGMDVVKKNIDKLGGRVLIESEADAGTTVIIRIPLTLAIVDGMEVSVGNNIYTIPITTIRESFKPERTSLIKDSEDNEMIMIRGSCYPVFRLNRLFGVKTDIEDLCDGIIVMVEANDKNICLFVDKLIGEQQVVVKSFPSYLMKYKVKESGIGGCTILGDGSISLIIDAASIIRKML